MSIKVKVSDWLRFINRPDDFEIQDCVIETANGDLFEDNAFPSEEDLKDLEESITIFDGIVVLQETNPPKEMSLIKYVQQFLERSTDLVVKPAPTLTISCEDEAVLDVVRKMLIQFQTLHPNLKIE